MAPAARILAARLLPLAHIAADRFGFEHSADEVEMMHRHFETHHVLHSVLIGLSSPVAPEFTENGSDGPIFFGL